MMGFIPILSLFTSLERNPGTEGNAANVARSPGDAIWIAALW